MAKKGTMSQFWELFYANFDLVFESGLGTWEKEQKPIGDLISKTVAFMTGFSKEWGTGIAQSFTDAETEVFLQVHKLMDTQLKRMGISDKGRAQILDVFVKQTTTIPFLQTVAAGFMWLDMTRRIIMQPIGAVGQLLDREARGIVQAEFLDIGTLIKTRWLAQNDQLWSKLVPHTGLNPDWQKVAEENLKVRPSVMDVFKLFRLGVYKEPDAKKRLEQLGVREEQDSFDLLNAALVRPDVGTAQEIFRRKLFNEEEMKVIWGGAFIPPVDIPIYERLATNLISEGELIELWRREKIDDIELDEGLEAKGWEKNARPFVKELKHRNLDLFDIRTGWLRGLMDEASFHKQLKRLGYDGDQQQLLKKTTMVLPTPTDLVRFGQREVFTPSIAQRFKLFSEFPEPIMKVAKQIGLSREVMGWYWAAHWDLPASGQGFDMFHRGIIDKPELQDLLKALDVNPFWRDRLIQLTFRLIPRRILPRLVRQEVLTIAGVAERFGRLGFNKEDRNLLAASAGLQALGPERESSKGEILSAYRRDLITRFSARDRLEELRYTERAVDLMLSNVDLKKETDKQRASDRADEKEEDRARQASKADILRSLRQGIIEQDTAVGMMEDIGFGKDAAAFITEQAILQGILDDQDFVAVQFRILFMEGVYDESRTRQRLSEFDFTSKQNDRLLDLWRVEKERIDLLEALPTRKPSKTDIDDWFIDNIITIIEWRVEMEALRYKQTHIDRYQEEIEVKKANQ